MARPKTSPFWIERIEREAENNPVLRASAVRSELQKLQAPTHAGPVPSERTIRNAIVEFRKRPESERKKLRVVSWPKTWTDGDLPWESQRAVLDFMASEHPFRPMVAEAQDFWRFTQAWPDSPVELRIGMTRTFRISRNLVGREDDPQFERALMFKKWGETEENQ